MTTIIRQGVKEDLPSVLQLIKELARYENSEHEVTITLEDLEKSKLINLMNQQCHQSSLRMRGILMD